MRLMFTLILACAGYVAHAFHPMFGYSELFILINTNQPGVYTINVDDQVITNSSGKFRFFDLVPGQKQVYVQRNGTMVYKGVVTVFNGSRTVAEIRGLRGLQVIQQVPLQQNNQMTQDFWYGYWNYNPNQNQWNNNPNQWNNNNNQNQWNNNPNQWNNNPPNNNMPVCMDQNTFSQFKETVRAQSFDNSKVTVIKNSARTANFCSTQVRDLLGLMSFDSYKLDVAKYCYDYVVDKQNYFKTYDQFSFDSNVKELSNYVANR